MISLKTITSFTGTDRMLLDKQGTGFESVGIAHRLKSFFGIGDARDRNIATLREIRNAVFSDLRFRTGDLHDRAESLLREVRTDRALDASRIRAIAQELQDLADGEDESALDKRVDLHLAAGSLPENLRGCADTYPEQVGFVARCHVRKVAFDTIGAAIVADPSVNPSEVVVDVAGTITDVANHCRAAIDAVHDQPDVNARDLADFVGKNLDRFVLNEDGTLRSFQASQDAGEFCHQASRGGHRWIRMDNPAITYGEAERAKPYEMAAVEFLAAAGKPVKPTLYPKIEQAVNAYADGQSFRHFALTIAPRDYTADDIRSRIASLAKEIYLQIDGDADFQVFCADRFGDKDIKAFEALGRYVAKLVAMRLPGDARAAICEKLHVQSASAAFEKAVRDAIVEELYL